MDLQKYLTMLDGNTEEVLAVLNSIGSDQVQKRIGEGWNILQVAEHIYVTEELVKKIISGSSNQQHEQDTVLGDEKIRRLLVELRERKIKAPERLNPTGKFDSLTQFSEALKVSRENLKTDLIEGRLLVSNAIYKHPTLGEMTVRDWLFFIVHHSKRHLKQIEDIVSAKN